MKLAHFETSDTCEVLATVLETDETEVTLVSLRIETQFQATRFASLLLGASGDHYASVVVTIDGAVVYADGYDAIDGGARVRVLERAFGLLAGAGELSARNVDYLRRLAGV